MLKMIKGLMKGPNSVVVILSGTERLIEIVGYDPQVSRRFTKIIPGDLQIGADNDNLTEVICDNRKVHLAMDTATGDICAVAFTSSDKGTVLFRRSCWRRYRSMSRSAR